jgi:hypothetical protein
VWLHDDVGDARVRRGVAELRLEAVSFDHLRDVSAKLRDGRGATLWERVRCAP